MLAITSRRTALAVAGVFVAIAVVITGVFLLLGGDEGQTPQAPTPTPTVSPSTTPPPETMTVKVFFHKGTGAPRDVVAVDRTVPKTTMPATAALNQLLAGPTAAERDSGLWSLFSDATATVLRSVRVGNGVARVDFRNFSKVIPNASTSTGSAILLAGLDATVRQFGNVHTTVYSFNGDINAFYLWLQYDPPVGQPPSPKEAVEVARNFMIRVIGMAQPMEGVFRSVGTWLGAVDFNPPPGENGNPLTHIVTTVYLQRTVVSWFVTGATTEQIQVAQPTRLQPMSSPVAVSGQALAGEGNVEVRVLQTAGTTVTQLGNGYVTGGGDLPRPFSGSIPFGKPGAPTGWLVFSERSAVDGAVMRATAVELTFAGVPAGPSVQAVALLPNLPVNDGWLTLPAGRGSLVLTIQTRATTKVEVFLAPTGTGTGKTVQLTGEAKRAGDQFTYTWNYADAPLLAHFTLAATGPGGRTENVVFAVYHG